MKALEGLFRKLEAVTGRDRDSILRRMVALRVPRRVEDDPAMDAQWSEDLRESVTAMEPPRDWADDGRAHGSPWTMHVVNSFAKCSGEMENDLCGKRLDGNFLEWCYTPLIRKPVFSTIDGCWLFDEIEVDVRSVVPHADNNVYLSTPHPAGDPVTAADKERVLSSFDNAAALECQLAAICLNCLIANLFGGSHGFTDMNVFSTEDELRKQADTFTGKVNIQEVTYSPPRT